jgi:hypothetical protein
VQSCPINGSGRSDPAWLAPCERCHPRAAVTIPARRAAVNGGPAFTLSSSLSSRAPAPSSTPGCSVPEVGFVDRAVQLREQHDGRQGRARSGHQRPLHLDALTVTATWSTMAVGRRPSSFQARRPSHVGAPAPPGRSRSPPAGHRSVSRSAIGSRTRAQGRRCGSRPPLGSEQRRVPEPSLNHRTSGSDRQRQACARRGPLFRPRTQLRSPSCRCKSMAFHDPLPAAPGRRTVHLGRSWALVFLELPSGLAFGVGLFHRGRLVEVSDEPREVRWLSRSLPGHAVGSVGPLRSAASQKKRGQARSQLQADALRTEDRVVSCFFG